MKLLQNIAAASCLIFLSGMNASAQETIKVDDPWKDYPSKKALYNDYSQWSIGINGGVPFFAGDFRSVTKGNGYWGGLIGLQGGYQFNPLFGIRLSVDYAANKAGSRDYEDDFILMPNAETYYNVDFPEGAKYYKELRSDIRMWNFGLNFEVNMFNLFRRSDGNRRWALLVAPGIYMQKFSTEVEEKGSGNRFADKLSNKVNLGLGDSIKAAEQRMAEIAVLRAHIVNYARTRPVYDAYRKAGYSKKFLEEHWEQITLHKAAKTAFDEAELQKLPKVKELDAEFAELLTKKKAAYPAYRKARDEMQELKKAQKNVELFFAEEKDPKEKSQTR